MADNLSVSISADETRLRSQLALAQADVRAFGTQVRTLAVQIRAGAGDGAVLRASLDQAAAGAAHAGAEVRKLNAELRGGGEAGGGFVARINGLKEAVEGFRAPLSGALGGLGGLAEAAGIGLVVDKVGELAHEMAELGEKTVNTAAAVGLPVEQFSRLSVAMELAGGDAESAARTLERLSHNVIEALRKPTSDAAQGFRELGISADELKTHGNDLTWVLGAIAEGFERLPPGVQRTDAVYRTMGRGLENLLPLLQEGKQGFQELLEKADETGAVLDNKTAQGMAHSGEEMHSLGATIRGDGVASFRLFKPLIDHVTEALYKLAGAFSAAINKVADWAAASRRAFFAVDNYFYQLFRGEGSALIPPVGGFGDETNGPKPKPPGPLNITPETRGGGRHRGGRGGSEDAAARREEREEEEADRKEAELFAAKERLKLAEAKGNTDQIAAIYNEWLAEIAAIYGKDSTQYLNLEREKVEAAQRASQERIRTLEEEYNKAIELGLRETEEQNRAAAEAQRKLDDQFKHFAEPIERSISSALTDAVLGIRQQGGLRDVLLGIEKSAVGGIMNNLVKGVGDSLLKPLFTSITGQGGFLGGLGSLLFGGGGQEATKISLLTSMNAFLATIAASTGATAAATTTSAATGPISGLFSAIGSIPVLGSVFKGIGSFFGGIFDQGGIVPSAAGGWSLPAFAGAMPALLHSQEMVLPADLSQGLQNMIRGGGAAQAAVHNHFHGPADGASIGRWFSQNRGDLVAAIRGAWDAGALSL